MHVEKYGQSKPLLKVLVYGEPGVGKTIFSSQAMDHPDLQKVLFVPIEGGLISIANRKPDFVNIGRNPDGTNNLRTLLDLEDLVWKLVTGSDGFAEYKTIVIDSVTDLQVKDIEDIVSAAKMKNPNRDFGEIQLGDYGKDTSRMSRILRMLRDSKLNVIITALAKKVQAENDSQPSEVGPDLTRNLAQKTMGYMDSVWLMYKDKEEVRTLLTQSMGACKAKTRLPSFAEKLGKTVKNPNLSSIYSLLCEAAESE